MEYLYPDYYDRFSCIAGKCEDTCCAGWQIVIDEKSLEKYEKVKGPFGNRLANSMNKEEQIFEQCGTRCAFLNEENLCDLYSELGEEALCETCTNYPRHIEEFEGLKEVNLSLSCPEACRIILGNKNKVTYEYKEVDEAEEEVEDFDFLFHSKLEDARDYLCEVMQNRDLSVKKRMAICLVFAHDMQRRIQHNEIFEIDELIEKYRKPQATERLLKKFKNYKWTFDEKYEWFMSVFGEYKTLEPLSDDWFTYLDCSLYKLGSLRSSNYWQLKQEYRLEIGTHQLEIEQIVVNLLYTYFCGAVYDYDVLSKMKFILMAGLMICELNFVKWVTEERFITMQDRVWITHWYSREIEHSDNNLNDLEHKLKTMELFHYKAMLSAIIS